MRDYSIIVIPLSMISSLYLDLLSQVCLRNCHALFLNDDALFISFMSSNSKFQAYDFAAVSNMLYYIEFQTVMCVVSAFVLGIGGY